MCIYVFHFSSNLDHPDYPDLSGLSDCLDYLDYPEYRDYPDCPNCPDWPECPGAQHPGLFSVTEQLSRGGNCRQFESGELSEQN